MRIGHYAPSVFAQGGIGRYIQRLGEAQESRGHPVVYLSKNPADPAKCTLVNDDGDLYETAVDQRLDVLHLHKEVGLAPPESLPVIRTMHGNQASCPSGSRYLAHRERVCDRKYSRFICTWGHIVDGCGSSKPARMQAHFQRIEKEKAVLPLIKTLTVSEFLRQNMMREGYPESRVSSLLSPAPDIDVSPQPVSTDNPPSFVFLGRIVPQKGIDWLIRAVAKVKNDCMVNVAGEGYYAEKAQEMAAELGVAEKICFHGWVDGPRAGEMIRNSRAVVFPSVWHEPAGLVTLEAAANRRAVITSAVGGIPEYADRSFSVVIEPHDVEELARAIDRFCEDRDLADSMGEAGLQYVREHHSFDNFVDQIQHEYLTVIEQKA